MEALPGWQLDAQAFLPSELGNFETTELLPGSFKDSGLSINDSAHEGVSSRGDSGEHSPETDEQTKRQGSTGEKTAKLAATANGRNKLAQKRYRERQRGKMETYKQQVDGLSKRLSELQTENESLEKRNRLLEKVVQMKDQKPKTPVSIEPFDVPANNLWQNTDTYAAVADYINTVRKQRLPLLTAQEAAHVSPEDLRALRADYVKEIATLLLAHGDNQASDGYKQLEDYVLQTRLASMNLFSSMSVRSFAQVLALKKRMSMGGSISERIMMAMNLSPDQKRDFVKSRQALIARNEDIKEKRRRIVGDLELAVPSIAPLMCGQTAAMLRACESSDQFKASLEEEHRSMATFHIECHQVLTPLQEARALLEAHPGNPDPWLISGYLEAEQSGNLKGWLAVHTDPRRSMLDLQAGEIKTEAPTTSGYAGSPFSNEVLGIGEGLANGSLAGQQPGAGLMFPGDGPLEMPLQKITQGSQDLLPATSLDDLSGLEGFATEDMWVDLFPGLLTQTQT